MDMVKKMKVLVVATIAAAAMAVPATASAAPANGTCVAKGVVNLQSAIPGAAQAGLVSSIIQDHLRNPQNWEWCR
jgi:ABC-type proline/glycine betaine transport system substrate-binding protein